MFKINIKIAILIVLSCQFVTSYVNAGGGDKKGVRTIYKHGIACVKPMSFHFLDKAIQAKSNVLAFNEFDRDSVINSMVKYYHDVSQRQEIILPVINSQSSLNAQMMQWITAYTESATKFILPSRSDLGALKYGHSHPILEINDFKTNYFCNASESEIFNFTIPFINNHDVMPELTEVKTELLGLIEKFSYDFLQCKGNTLFEKALANINAHLINQDVGNEPAFNNKRLAKIISTGYIHSLAINKETEYLEFLYALSSEEFFPKKLDGETNCQSIYNYNMLSFFESVNLVMDVTTEGASVGSTNKEVSYHCLFNKFESNNKCVDTGELCTQMTMKNMIPLVGVTSEHEDAGIDFIDPSENKEGLFGYIKNMPNGLYLFRNNSNGNVTIVTKENKSMKLFSVFLGEWVFFSFNESDDYGFPALILKNTLMVWFFRDSRYVYFTPDDMAKYSLHLETKDYNSTIKDYQIFQIGFAQTDGICNGEMEVDIEAEAEAEAYIKRNKLVRATVNEIVYSSRRIIELRAEVAVADPDPGVIEETFLEYYQNDESYVLMPAWKRFLVRSIPYVSVWAANITNNLISRFQGVRRWLRQFDDV